MREARVDETAEQRAAAGIDSRRPEDWKARLAAGRKTHGYGKGHRKSRAAVEKGVATKKAAGVYTVVTAKLVDEARTVRGRVRSALNGRLRHRPSPEPVEWEAWAAGVAHHYGLTKDAVVKMWESTLQRRGLLDAAPQRTGRRRNAKRHLLVSRLMQTWPRKADGDLADGFWKKAFNRVSELEGKKAPGSTATLRRWWIEFHRVPCGVSHRLAA